MQFRHFITRPIKSPGNSGHRQIFFLDFEENGGNTLLELDGFIINKKMIETSVAAIEKTSEEEDVENEKDVKAILLQVALVQPVMIPLQVLCFWVSNGNNFQRSGGVFGY